MNVLRMISRGLPDKLYLQMVYFKHFNKFIDFNNPKTFNEKLQWLKLYNRKSEYTVMVDKHLVKEYVANIIGQEYIIPTLGVWSDANEIEWNILPEQFVLKCNNDSGGIVICKDKDKLNIQETIRFLNKRLKNNGFWYGREWPYKGVKPCIIAEKFMSDEGNELADYKIHNFNGVPKAVLVCRDRFKESGLTEDFFNCEWKHLDVSRINHPNSTESISMPSHLDDMLELSKRLSQSIPFVRTDFYDVGGKIYFGEMTFYPASGFEKFVPDKYDDLLGGWLKIPNGGGGGVLIKQ